MIDHRIDEFGIILNGFPLYQGKELPKAYAEAAALLTAQGKNLRPRFKYSTDYDDNFRRFYKAGTKKNPTEQDVEFVNQYRGTYWYNFFFTQPGDQISNGTNNTRVVN